MGNRQVDYTSWAKITQLIKQNAPGWEFNLRQSESSNFVWSAPNGTGFFVCYFTSPEKEALWGEIFEMCGYTDTHDQYFNTIIVDYTYKQLLEQHYNISILMKDKAFVEMCDELAECYSESRAYMYLNNMRWNDWDELRYQCENEGIDFYAIEEKYRANLDRVVTENDVMARIASMGGAVPINMPASPQEEVEVNRQVINDDIPF